MAKLVTMLELEERLLADADGSLRAGLIGDLNRMRDRLQGELRKMNDRARFQELQGALQAVMGALQVLRTLRVPANQQAHLVPKK